MKDAFGDVIPGTEDPPPDWFDQNPPPDQGPNGLYPPPPNQPPPGQGNWPGSGAYWTLPDGTHGRNPWITSDADYAKYTYEPSTGRLTLRSAAATAPGGASAFFDASGKFNGDYEGYFYSLFPNAGPGGLTAAMLKAKEAELNKAGITLHASTSNDNINVPGIGLVDVIQGAGELNQRAWQPPSPRGGGGGGFDPNTIGSLLQPFPGEFASVAGKFPTLSIPEFAFPTGEEVLKEDPGYLFRVGQGERALTQGRVAQGTAYTGGTLKDILNYGQAAGSQEFASAVQRRQTQWGMNKDRLLANYDAAYKNYLDQYNMFRQRQQDTNQYLTDQQRIGIQANQ
jgi:hypothetical protein